MLLLKWERFGNFALVVVAEIVKSNKRTIIFSAVQLFDRSLPSTRVESKNGGSKTPIFLGHRGKKWTSLNIIKIVVHISCLPDRREATLLIQYSRYYKYSTYFYIVYTYYAFRQNYSARMIGLCEPCPLDIMQNLLLSIHYWKAQAKKHT